MNYPETKAYANKKRKLTCPGCGSPIFRTKHGYQCKNYEGGCKFYIKDTYASKKLTTTQVENLIFDGVSGDKPITGFVSKYGKTFSAFLNLSVVVSNGLVKSCKVDFTYPAQDEEALATAKALAKGLYCPGCQSPIIAGKKGWKCSEGCGFALHYEIANRKMTGAELFELVMRGETPVLHGFISKSGAPFSASIKLAEDGRSTDLEFVEEKERTHK